MDPRDSSHGDVAATSARAAKRTRGRPPRDATAADSSREKLLDVAIELFANWGYEPVSTAAVARAAGLAQSMVHYHFGSKEQLWRAAIERLMRRRGRFFPVTRLEFADIGPLDRLKMLIRRLVEANAAEPHYVRIITHEAMADTPRFAWLMEHYVAPGIAPFDEAIREAIEAGLIRPLPAADVSRIITSAASLTFALGAVSRFMYGEEGADPASVASYSDSVVAIVMQGLTPRS